MKSGTLMLVLGGAAAAVGAALVLGRHRTVRGKLPEMTPEGETVGASGARLKVYRGDMSIKKRLRLLQGLVAKSVRDPDVRRLALSITNGCEARDDECEARAIYEWVKSNIRYTGDIGPHALWPGGPVEPVDLFVTAKRAIENKGDDCDGHSVVVAALAIDNGFTVKLRVSSPEFLGRDNYTHIYPMIGFPKNDPQTWVAADTTLPNGRFGTEHPSAKTLDVIA